MTARTAEELKGALAKELERTRRYDDAKWGVRTIGPEQRTLEVLLELNDRLARIEAHMAGPWHGMKLEKAGTP